MRGFYFEDADEANEWLEFDCSADEAEQQAWLSPDQFAEWQRFRTDAA